VIHLINRGFVVWLLLMIAESIHGIFRGLLIAPMIGDFRARQVAVFSGILIVALITFIFVRWLKGSSVKEFLLIGSLWVVLTVTFEVLLGRLVMNASWGRIFADYDLMNGGLMPVGLFAMFLAPLAMAKLLDEV